MQKYIRKNTLFSQEYEKVTCHLYTIILEWLGKCRGKGCLRVSELDFSFPLIFTSVIKHYRDQFSRRLQDRHS